jgi:molybdate-binding protein
LTSDTGSVSRHWPTNIIAWLSDWRRGDLRHLEVIDVLVVGVVDGVVRLQAQLVHVAERHVGERRRAHAVARTVDAHLRRGERQLLRAAS